MNSWTQKTARLSAIGALLAVSASMMGFSSGLSSSAGLNFGLSQPAATPTATAPAPTVTPTPTPTPAAPANPATSVITVTPTVTHTIAPGALSFIYDPAPQWQAEEVQSMATTISALRRVEGLDPVDSSTEMNNFAYGMAAQMARAGEISEVQSYCTPDGAVCTRATVHVTPHPGVTFADIVRREDASALIYHPGANTLGMGYEEITQGPDRGQFVFVQVFWIPT